MVWEPVLELFSHSIDENGYYYCPYSFKKFANENELEAVQDTPNYVSINFWSEQRDELKSRGWYVTRLSRGSFGIFAEEVFPKPYTDLTIKKTEKLRIGEFSSQPHIKDAFNLMMSRSSAENTILELLRFGGVYEAFMKKFSKTTRYIVGPRGNFWPKFDLHMRDKNNKLATFKYHGQTELDYSLWAEDRIFIIEAKSQPKSGLDVGWHKLSFPCQFYSEIARKHGLEIIPVYLLRNFSDIENTIYIFVFPPYESYNENGLILNDQSAMTPEHVVSLDLNLLVPLPQRKLRSFTT